MLEAVLESAVRPLCDTIDMFKRHSEYVDVMLRTLSTPDTGMMSGPKRQGPTNPANGASRFREASRYE